MTFKPVQQADESVDTDETDDTQSQDNGTIGDDLASAIEEVAGQGDESAGKDGGVPDEVASIFGDPEKKAAGPSTEAKKVDDDGKPVEKPVDNLDADGKPIDTLLAGDGKDALKAPVGWDAPARELWSKVHPDVQKIIHDREKFIATNMQESAQSRGVHQHIAKVAQAYKPIMDAEGVSDPLVAIDGLFKTVAELRMGSPEQKAVRMAAMIKHYAIDVEALDNALVGQTPVPSANSAMENMINERMAPVNQLLEQLQGRQLKSQEASVKEAEDAVAAFEGEFLSDVRNDMADLIDFASARGQQMSLQDAYDKAVILRPEIQSVLTQRQKDAELLGNQNNLSGKLDAASSLSGKQSGGGDGAMGGGSLRGTIEELWGEKATGRI